MVRFPRINTLHPQIDMLLAIDEENKLTLLNLKTKEGKRWSSHSISCGK